MKTYTEALHESINRFGKSSGEISNIFRDGVEYQKQVDQARIQKLREALKPFAELYDKTQSRDDYSIYKVFHKYIYNAKMALQADERGE